MASSDPDSTDTRGLMKFLDASPSPYHAVHEASQALAAAGFSALTFADEWPDAGGWYVQRGGALLAGWTPPGSPAGRGPRIIGAHTDSPNLRVKPRPDTGSVGWRQ